MKIYLLTVFLVFGLAQSQNSCDKSGVQNANRNSANRASPEKTRNGKDDKEKTMKYDNLPDGVSPIDEVREETKGENGEISYKIITVEEKLREIGAKYEGEKLVGANGKEIKFYKPPVRGASQGFEEDKKQRERDERELNSLKEKYAVIVLYANPLKVM